MLITSYIILIIVVIAVIAMLALQLGLRLQSK